MKLILEKWNKYIVSETVGWQGGEPLTPIQTENVLLLSTEADNRPGFESFLENQLFSDADIYPLTDHIEELVRQVPALSSEKITSIAGVGTKGVALRLKNGNILKLYVGGWLDSSIDPGSEEEKFYASEKSKMFSADGSVSTLPVYDQGTADVHDAMVKYTEMAEVMPFDKYLDFTGRSSDNDMLEIETAITTIKRVVLMAELPDYYGPPANQVTLPQRIERAIRSIRVSKLTGPEVRGLTIMLKYVITKYGPEFLEDFHEGNFGVVQQTIATNRPAFVLFDP
jgi:hypothetical protein